MEMLSASSAAALGHPAPAMDAKGETDVYHYVSVQGPRLWSYSPAEGKSEAKLTPNIMMHLAEGLNSCLPKRVLNVPWQFSCVSLIKFLPCFPQQSFKNSSLSSDLLIVPLTISVPPVFLRR